MLLLSKHRSRSVLSTCFDVDTIFSKLANKSCTIMQSHLSCATASMIWDCSGPKFLRTNLFRFVSAWHAWSHSPLDCRLDLNYRIDTATAIWNASTRLGRKWSQTCWMDISVKWGGTFCAGVKKLKHMFEKWKTRLKCVWKLKPLYCQTHKQSKPTHSHDHNMSQSHGLGGAVRFPTSLFHTQWPSSNHPGFARVLQKFLIDVQNQPKSELRMSKIPKSKYFHILLEVFEQVTSLRAVEKVARHGRRVIFAWSFLRA